MQQPSAQPNTTAIAATAAAQSSTVSAGPVGAASQQACPPLPAQRTGVPLFPSGSCELYHAVALVTPEVLPMPGEQVVRSVELEHAHAVLAAHWAGFTTRVLVPGAGAAGAHAARVQEGQASTAPSAAGAALILSGAVALCASAERGAAAGSSADPRIELNQQSDAAAGDGAARSAAAVGAAGAVLL